MNKMLHRFILTCSVSSPGRAAASSMDSNRFDQPSPARGGTGGPGGLAGGPGMNGFGGSIDELGPTRFLRVLEAAVCGSAALT